MSEQEKLQQEKLAIEALEEISGGTITKEDAKKYLNDAKGLGKKHWDKLVALVLTVLGSGLGAEEYKHGGRALRDLYDWVSGAKHELKVDEQGRAILCDGRKIIPDSNFGPFSK